MNTRISYDTKGRLRRAKSTSSVQRRRQIPPVPEPLDPVTAKHHALAAASRAFQRASERSSADSRGSFDYMNGNEANVFSQRRRPPSIRFSDGGRSASQMSMSSTSPSVPFTAGSVMEDTNSPTSPSILPPISEFQGPDGGDSSVPSSYRRLRKAKSMFSTRHRTSNFTDHGTACLGSGSPVQKEILVSNPPYASLRRSMSFFKGGNQYSQSLRHTKSHDAAIQLARDQFLRDNEEQQRRSSILALKHRRGQKPLRRTIRSSSESGVGVAASPSWSEHMRRGGFHAKIRTLSVSTIKRGLKRVFGRTKSTEHRLPPENVHSPQTELGHYISSGLGTDPEGLPETPAEEVCSHGVSYGYPDYYRGSINRTTSEAPTVRIMQSSESLCTSNSRVTSWADSTVANTIMTKNPADRNSLCIIREHGDSAQSATFASPESYIRRGYAVFSKPLRARSSANKLDGSVDTQRVYSALMKRIDNATLQQDEQILVGTVPGGQPIPERASSIYSLRSSRSIRQVPSESSIKSTASFFTANVRPFSTHSPSPVRNSCPSQSQVQQNEHQNRTSHHRSPALRESGSTFFPTPPYGKPGTPSPYRRAMASIDRAPDYSDEDSGSVIISRLVRGETEPDSPSVYSRTTGGNTPKQQGATGNIDNSPRSTDTRGMATIFESRRTKYVSPRRANSSRPTIVPVKPSGDWQKWMSSEIARIDRHGSVVLQTQPVAREHYREETQIEDEVLQHPESLVDDNMSKSRSPRSPRGPLVELQAPTQSNFSRPLYRSRNTVSSVSLRRPSKSGKVSGVDEQADVFGISADPLKTSPISSNVEVNIDQSLARSRSNGSIQIPGSPTSRRETNKLRQRYSVCEQYQNSPFTQLSDGGDAKGVQFQSIRSRRDIVRSAKENSRTSSILSYGDVVSENHMKLQGLQSTISSKRMVDMFLSSRRQQNTTSDSSEPAFL